MGQRYTQINNGDSSVRFSKAVFGEVESSRMTATPIHLTTFNAGDIVPIYCREILPDECIDMSIDFVIRQTTLLTPTMGCMHVDFYAFFVPNRIVNQSWKAVEGENFNGSWTANPVSLAPLVSFSVGSTKINVGSVADYYGFPTQQAIPNSVLNQCHDLKFRGYAMIWNEHFRDQNYQPPIALSTLNTNQHFLDGSGTFNANDFPLKANKLHDYFTSVLPSPQKGGSVFAAVTGSISDSIPVVTSNKNFPIALSQPLKFKRVTTGDTVSSGTVTLGTGGSAGYSTSSVTPTDYIYPSNLETASGVEVTGLELSVDDLRMAAAMQQVYETLARGGSRYRELISSFFGIDIDDPFSDIPRCLGHISRELDLYQTAQTSASSDGSTAQGNLAAFGYTSSNGKLVDNYRFVEHGYLHVLAVVRHRNIYSSMLARDNFRLNMLDFYTPQLANISEQPVYAREINPFCPKPNNAFGYQEAWAEYRYEPDSVSAFMRPGVTDNLSIWNYADDFNSSLQIATGNWLKSNSEEVLDRSLAVNSSVAPQFKGQFRFIVDKTLPMPTYSVPGMDII